MRKSSITAEFASPIEKVWAIVTDNAHTGWRSDLDRVEIKDGKTFTEFTKEGFSTTFVITELSPMRRYAFQMENARFTGDWEGVFTSLPGGGTRIVFSEVLRIKNPVMELLSHLFMNLKKTQQTYVQDLRKALKE